MLLIPSKASVLKQPPQRMLQSVARTFASFPYPETVITWSAEEPDGTGNLSAFNRTERTPLWAAGESTEEPFPVIVAKDPVALAERRALVGEGELGAGGMGGLRDAPGNRPLVGHAHDQATLALHQPGDGG